jgi:hypothetical protein
MTFEQMKPKEKPIITDFLQWVGGNFYSVESFKKEVKKMGASRRVSYVPKNIVVGKSKLFLISDMQSEEMREKYKAEYNRRLRESYIPKNQWIANKKYGSIKKQDPMPRDDPIIFGYFIINNIIYVTDSTHNLPEELGKLGVVNYTYQEGDFGFNDERGCGSLQVGGVYFISENDMEKVKQLASSVELESKNVHFFDVPISASGIRRFRGIKEVPQEKFKEIESAMLVEKLDS